MSTLSKSFTDAKQVYEDFSARGKHTVTILEIISDTEEKIDKLESLRRELLGIIGATERYQISKSVLELRENTKEFNLEMRKMGVFLTIKDDAISYSDKIKLQYLSYSRPLQKYVYEINGDKRFISSKGVTSEILLNPIMPLGRQKKPLDLMNEVVVEISSMQGISMEEGLKILNRHMDKMPND